jgi:CRISPR/Cas system-associated exonuclease Cas4 (RecB family)
MEKVGPVDLSEVREVLADRLSFLRVEPPSERYGRVFVGTLEEAAGRCFEIVFLPGLAEGIMPKKVLEDPLLLDEARIRVGEGLVTRQDKAERERLLLRLGVGAASHHLTVSYPRMDVIQGRARVPSLYALELLKAAEGSLPDLGTLERWAAEDTSASLGWPAPGDARDAIDTAEYDLSILEPVLHSSGRAGEGRGRFLLKVNPFLSRSIRARYKRWLGGWSDDDGIVASQDPKVIGILSEHRLTRRSFSPTALQNYAACPYRFFLYGIHRLQPRQEITTIEQMDPLIRGSLFHQVQFELFRRLDLNGPASWGDVDVNMTLDQVDEVLDEVAAAYEEDLAPAIPRIWESEVEDLRVDLRCWVRDVTRKDQEWTPIHAEFSFGLPLSDSRDPGSRAEVARILNGCQLRGAIDLIERNEARGTIRVTDHKTGRAPKPAPRFVGNGEVLQPLLYGLAAEVLLEKEVEAAQLFYCTQRGDFKRCHFDLSGEARKSIQQIIETIDRALARGFLPAAPREGACTYCDYRPVCGPYEELRVTRKPRQPIADLEAIRRIP